MEWSILICVALLVVIGLVALYSATLGTGHEEFKKQVMWLAISIPFLVITMFLDYEILAKISPILYGISIILLIAVLFTEPISGASSWFVIKKTISFQPSEFAKVAVVLAYSYLVARLQTKGRDEISRPTRLFASLLAVAVPVLLIVKQPDYGTAMAFLFAIVAILFVAGIKKRYIFIALALVVIALPLLYFFVLPNHAKTRIDVFLNPEIDARGSGYNILQSKLAIGAGEMFGMGIGKGNQTQLGFFISKNHRLYFFRDWRGIRICRWRQRDCVIYSSHYESHLYCQNRQGRFGLIYCSRNCWYFHLSHDGEYWNDDGAITNYRSTTTIC